MKRLMQLSTILILLLGLNGCKDDPCPKISFPDIQAIDRVPTRTLDWGDDGVLGFEDTQYLGWQNERYKISENYYYRRISDYRKEFIIK